MDKTNKILMYSDDLNDMYGSEQDRLDNYNEIRKINNAEPITEYTEAVDNYYYDILRDDYDIFKSEYGDLHVLVIADLGLWYGRRNGGQIGYLKDLLPKMCEDYTEILFNPEKGIFEIEASHHDGCNYFKVYAISAEGNKYLDEEVDDYSDRLVHEYLIEHKETLLTKIKI